jgi:hypothetical protein
MLKALKPGDETEELKYSVTGSKLKITGDYDEGKYEQIFTKYTGELPPMN